jgi:transketolase
MPLSAEDKERLIKTARDLRLNIIDVMTYSGGAHVGGSLSIADLLTVLYFKALNVDPKNPDDPDRDRFILSKGHAAAGFIPALAMRGFFPLEELATFNHFGSPFAMHPDASKINGVDASTGSLGHGLPMAIGMGLGAKLLKKSWKTVCLLGDGECCEGSVWEAAMALSNFKLTNVITVIDRNKLMIDGFTEDVMKLEPFAEKWKAFGFEVLEIDGHSVEAINDALEKAWKASVKPIAIIANTIKGKGVDFMENNVKWHYASADSDLAKRAKDSILKGVS